MTHSLTLPVINPSTGELLAAPQMDTTESALGKIDAAHRHFKNTDQHLALHERIHLLNLLCDRLSADKNEFLSIMVKEGGKPWKDSQVEFQRAVAGITLAINTISEQVGATVPLGYQSSSANRFANTRYFPLGVVLAFSAFNHPLNLIIHQAIPAFAAGCPCVIKPAPDTPLTCLKLVEAMLSVGIPQEYIHVVVTDDHALAGKLVESNKIAFFSFIGSAKVGWMLRSRLQPGVRCALEHGGIAPCIISSQGDVARAANAIAKGGFYHAGQVCVSTQRVFVASSVVDVFVEQLLNKLRVLKVGNAMDQDTDIGPIIRSAEIKRIEQWVQEAIDEGAECVYGGKINNEHYYLPTVLINPSEQSKVSQEEIFGPVICVYTYEDFANILPRINHEKYAFQAAIFSDNLQEIMLAYEQIDASALMVNDHTAFRDDVMPFAGLKQSGLGVGGIPHTINEMRYEKMLVINTP